MLFVVSAFVKFLCRSSNEHGVHSPFVFNLVTQCFYDKTVYPEYNILKYHRSALLKNKSVIEISDFGAGSRYFKSTRRSVAKMARQAGTSEKRAQLLFRIIKHFKIANTLELGTSVGLSTCAMALANPDGTVQTVEGCAATLKCAQHYFVKLGLHNINSVCSNFNHFTFEEGQTFDLIFFDGHHQKEATLHYFEKFLPTAHNNSVWIFDDIHWSAGMQQAWETIKAHDAVQVTIDTFQWGLVFFRKEQVKEHFTIRI